MSLLSDYFDKDKRSTAIGIWYLSSGIGLALAFFIGGWIIEVSNWRWAFFAAGIPGLLLAPILFLTVREPKRGNRDEVPAVDETAGLSFVGRIRLLSSRPGLLHCISAIRSEEHTSELQSLMRISYAVFCLKKKKHTHNPQHITT